MLSDYAWAYYTGDGGTFKYKTIFPALYIQEVWVDDVLRYSYNLKDKNGDAIPQVGGVPKTAADVSDFASPITGASLYEFTISVVTAGSAPPAFTNYNNVKILFRKSDNARLDALKVFSASLATSFGIQNGTRLFLSGFNNNATYSTNLEWTTRAIWSSPLDPTNFPVANFRDVGSDKQPVTGMVQHYSYLAMFKRDFIWKLDADAGGSGTEFNITVTPLNDEVGCIAPKSIALVNNNPVFLSETGLRMLKSTQLKDELNTPLVSEKNKQQTKRYYKNSISRGNRQ